MLSKEITIKIAERDFKVQIQPEEEEVFRKVAKQINERIQEHKPPGGMPDSLLILAKVCFLYAVELHDAEQDKNQHIKEEGNRIKQLSEMLDKAWV